MVRYEKNLILYSSILKKTLEMNEINHKTSRVSSYKITSLIIALAYQTLQQINAMRDVFHSVVGYADYLINIFVNINGNIRT